MDIADTSALASTLERIAESYIDELAKSRMLREREFEYLKERDAKMDAEQQELLAQQMNPPKTIWSEDEEYEYMTDNGYDDIPF
jgi:hypothetical protein